MASPLRSRVLPSSPPPSPLTLSLFSLPPCLRTSTYLQNHSAPLPRRHFSASSPRRQSTLVDTLTTPPTWVLDSVHGLGVPWWAAIPLSSFFIRSTVIYYLAMRPDRKRAIVQSHIQPLVELKAVRKTTEIIRGVQRRHDDIKEASLPLLWKATRFRQGIMEKNRLGKKFKGETLWHWWASSFYKMGIIMVFAEAIRSKCGTRDGLLTFVTAPLVQLGAWLSPSQDVHSLSGLGKWMADKLEAAVKGSDPHSWNPLEMIGSRLEAALEAARSRRAEVHSETSPLLDTSHTGSLDANAFAPDGAAYVDGLDLSTLQSSVPTFAERLDPTMLTEGPYWCPDLTVADPYHILPLALGLAIVTNIKWREKFTALVKTNAAAKKRTGVAVEDVESSLVAKFSQETSKLTNSDRLSLCLALIFPALMWQMPAGIMLYILTSSAVNKLQMRWINAKYPLPTPVTPCKRPMRMKVKRGL